MKIKTIIITMETVWQIVADNTNESQIYKLTKLYLLFNLFHSFNANKLGKSYHRSRMLGSFTQLIFQFVT